MLRLIDGNNVFKRHFHSMGTTSLQSLYLDSISHNPNLLQIMWVWDGYQSNQRRKDIYPEYKGGRPPSTDEFHQTRRLFKELLGHSSCMQLEIPTYEADDAIAKIALGTEADVTIESTDQDFHTLVKKNLVLDTQYPSPVPKHLMKMYKVLVGDKSDNIPGLLRFGQKTWDNMSEDNIVLLERFITQTDVLSAEEIVEHLGFKPAMQKSFLESADLLRKFYQVVTFIDVPDDLISEHLTVGNLNQDAAFARLSELFMY